MTCTLREHGQLSRKSDSLCDITNVYDGKCIDRERMIWWLHSEIWVPIKLSFFFICSDTFGSIVFIEQRIYEFGHRRRRTNMSVVWYLGITWNLISCVSLFNVLSSWLIFISDLSAMTKNEIMLSNKDVMCKLHALISIILRTYWYSYVRNVWGQKCY